MCRVAPITNYLHKLSDDDRHDLRHRQDSVSQAVANVAAETVYD